MKKNILLAALFHFIAFSSFGAVDLNFFADRIIAANESQAIDQAKKSKFNLLSSQLTPQESRFVMDGAASFLNRDVRPEQALDMALFFMDDVVSKMSLEEGQDFVALAHRLSIMDVLPGALLVLKMIVSKNPADRPLLIESFNSFIGCYTPEDDDEDIEIADEVIGAALRIFDHFQSKPPQFWADAKDISEKLRDPTQENTAAFLLSDFFDESFLLKILKQLEDYKDVLNLALCLFESKDFDDFFEYYQDLPNAVEFLSSLSSDRHQAVVMQAKAIFGEDAGSVQYLSFVNTNLEQLPAIMDAYEAMITRNAEPIETMHTKLSLLGLLASTNEEDRADLVQRVSAAVRPGDLEDCGEVILSLLKGMTASERSHAMALHGYLTNLPEAARMTVEDIFKALSEIRDEDIKRIHLLLENLTHQLGLNAPEAVEFLPLIKDQIHADWKRMQTSIGKLMSREEHPQDPLYGGQTISPEMQEKNRQYREEENRKNNVWIAKAFLQMPQDQHDGFLELFQDASFRKFATQRIYNDGPVAYYLSKITPEDRPRYMRLIQPFYQNTEEAGKIVTVLKHLKPANLDHFERHILPISEGMENEWKADLWSSAAEYIRPQKWPAMQNIFARYILPLGCDDRTKSGTVYRLSGLQDYPQLFGCLAPFWRPNDFWQSFIASIDPVQHAIETIQNPQHKQAFVDELMRRLRHAIGTGIDVRTLTDQARDEVTQRMAIQNPGRHRGAAFEIHNAVKSFVTMDKKVYLLPQAIQVILAKNLGVQPVSIPTALQGMHQLLEGMQNFEIDQSFENSSSPNISALLERQAQIPKYSGVIRKGYGDGLNLPVNARHVTNLIQWVWPYIERCSPATQAAWMTFNAEESLRAYDGPGGHADSCPLGIQKRFTIVGFGAELDIDPRLKAISHFARTIVGLTGMDEVITEQASPYGVSETLLDQFWGHVASDHLSQTQKEMLYGFVASEEDPSKIQEFDQMMKESFKKLLKSDPGFRAQGLDLVEDLLKDGDIQKRLDESLEMHRTCDPHLRRLKDLAHGTKPVGSAPKRQRLSDDSHEL